MSSFRAAMRRLTRPRTGSAGAIRALEEEVARLRVDIDELRADSARIAELYDVVVERLRSEHD